MRTLYKRVKYGCILYNIKQLYDFILIMDYTYNQYIQTVQEDPEDNVRNVIPNSKLFKFIVALFFSNRNTTDKDQNSNQMAMEILNRSQEKQAKY